MLDVAKKLKFTQFRFWFQPLDLLKSVLPDAFLSWNRDSCDINALKELKHQYGNGYLKVDHFSPPFIDDKILWIPAMYFSAQGESLDLKTPLQKSLEKIHDIPFLEIEQSFYLIDCELYVDDLVDLGARVFAFSDKITVDETRVSLFIRELKQSASIDIEIASIGGAQFIAKTKKEKCLLSVDQNIQMMEIIKRVAKKNNIVALFHEKPFPDLPCSEKKITISLNVPTHVIQHALQEHESFIQAALLCFNQEPRLSGVKPSITCLASEIVIRGLSPSAHPALAISAILAAIADSLQLPKHSIPVSFKTTPWGSDVSPFLDPRTVRAFAFALNGSELLHLQELCLAKYEASIKAIIVSMKRQFDAKVFPLLITQDLMKRATIAQEITDLQTLLFQMQGLGLEAQVKVLSDLGISKILKAKLSVKQFINTLRI